MHHFVHDPLPGLDTSIACEEVLNFAQFSSPVAVALVLLAVTKTIPCDPSVPLFGPATPPAPPVAAPFLSVSALLPGVTPLAAVLVGDEPVV